MIYSIVDLGSNTIRLSVYQCKEEGFHLLFHKKIMAGLAGYVEKGNLSATGVSIAIAALNDFKHIVETFDMGKMIVFATASLRNIKNSKEVVEEIEAATGIKIDLISGKEEARLDFVGILQNHGFQDGLLIDIGGGSTELVVFQNNEIKYSSSVPIGSLMLWHKFVEGIMPTEKEIKQMKTYIQHALIKNSDVPKGEYPMVYGVGGTIRACMKVSNLWYERPMDNREVHVDVVKNLIKMYRHFGNGFTNQLIQAAPERVHSFIPGILILREVLKYYDCVDISVSSYGVREGYLVDRVLHQGEQHEEQQIDVLPE